MKIPRAENNVSQEIIAQRVALLRDMGVDIIHTTHYSIDPATTTGNVENFIGVAQVPIGLAGPVRMNGEYAQGDFVVPLATTEGALVASCSRGMKAITDSGGCVTHIRSDYFVRGGIFLLSSTTAAVHLARWSEQHVEDIARQFETSTRHGRLCQLVTHLAGCRLFIEFRIATGEAMGSNMCSNAVEMTCQWISQQVPDAKDSYLGVTPNDKKPDNISSMTGKGKNVVAEALIPESVMDKVLHTNGKDMVSIFECVEEWWTLSGARGHNGSVANQLAALYIACGQDPAYIAEACAGHTNVSPGREGGVHITVILPSVIVGTVGAGSALPTSKECLRILGCEGAGSAGKLAEIAAAVALAGELSGLAALASGEFVRAHNRLGRNRPESPQTVQPSAATHVQT